MIPSAYEPCGLAQMVGLRYGSLPIVHRTGGLGDTVVHLDSRAHAGNGFLFLDHDANGLRWAIDEAMRFHLLSLREKTVEISRIMGESEAAFSPEPLINRFLAIYQNLCGNSAVMG